MKTYIKLLAALLLLLPLVAWSQKDGPAKKSSAQGSGQKPPAVDCYHEWNSLFRERGAAKVPDGTHPVVISLWNSISGTSKCYLGQVEVIAGKIKRPVMVQKEDGTYEPFSTLGKGLDPAVFKTMSEDQLTTITDGMSPYIQLSEIEGGQIFFYTFINPKPKGLKEAPSAKSLIKN